ncbi:MAG: metallophosphoesterase [Candidatus Aminicenantes bacterium]|nr:MAG: metallophosphoesterase [Candidatus Aminicenantes bacterium]
MPNFIKNITKVILSGLLITCLFLPMQADSKQSVWEGVERIIAVGDIHGDYEHFVEILQKCGLVDEKLKWSAGKTHLVQTGDIMDRGDHARRVFDLLMRLQKEAEEAGGKVHVLLGNHEEMNITGIVFRQPTYVTPKQFASFLPDDFREKKENEFREQLTNLSEIESNSDPTILESYFETKWENLMKNKKLHILYVNNFNKVYGKWLLDQNVVIKINDIIFSHGGISEKYAQWPLQKLNDVMRSELNTHRIANKRGIIPRMKRQILYMPDSPLWNRELALKEEKTYSHVVDSILEKLDAKVMVIAHTPVGSPVIPENQKDERDLRTRFDEKIWMIDTGISDFYYGILSYLHYENGEFIMKEWRAEEYVEEEPFEPSIIKPGDVDREDVEYYLKNAAVVKVSKEAVPGRTAAWEINLDDGEFKRRAMFKVVDVTRPSSIPDSYKYELAAYALDKLLGFGRIPPLMEREIEGTKGSLQIRVEKCFGLDEQKMKNATPPDPTAFANALEEINVFENLVYIDPKELDDILIQRESWEIYRVDFSEAFNPNPNLIPEQKIKRCSKKLYQNLQELSDEVIKARLSLYINEEEMSALLNRKILIIKTLEKLIEEKGEEAVLF